MTSNIFYINDEYVSITYAEKCAILEMNTPTIKQNIT